MHMYSFLHEYALNHIPYLPRGYSCDFVDAGQQQAIVVTKACSAHVVVDACNHYHSICNRGFILGCSHKATHPDMNLNTEGRNSEN